jgi:hypothetical protein
MQTVNSCSEQTHRKEWHRIHYRCDPWIDWMDGWLARRIGFSRHLTKKALHPNLELTTGKRNKARSG